MTFAEGEEECRKNNMSIVMIQNEEECKIILDVSKSKLPIGKNTTDLWINGTINPEVSVNSASVAKQAFYMDEQG